MMVGYRLAQGLEVPPLSSARIAAEADAVLREYADLVGAETLAPIEVEDIAVSLLKLSVGFDNLQDSFDDRVHGAIWFSRCEIWIDDELNPSFRVGGDSFWLWRVVSTSQFVIGRQ